MAKRGKDAVSVAHLDMRERARTPHRAGQRAS